MIINGNRYVTATAEDFETVSYRGTSPNNYYRLQYVGNDDYVFLPEIDTLKTRPRTDSVYVDMFDGTNVKGVASYGVGVTSMRGMFRNTTSASLDLTGLYTNATTSTNGMFDGSAAIVIYGMNKFNTSRVTDMRSMFKDTSLPRIDLRNFDTSNVTHMGRMFEGVSADIIDVTTFNTSKVKDFQYMFSNIEVDELDIANFDFSHYDYFPYSTYNYANKKGIFKGAKIGSINMSSFGSEVHEEMFMDSTIGSGLYLNGLRREGGRFNGGNAKDLFNGFSGATEIDLSSVSLKSEKRSNSSSKINLDNIVSNSSIETIYVKDSASRRQLIGYFFGLIGGEVSKDIEVIIGGEGYIEPVVRPPAPLTDPGDGDILEVIPGETTTETIEFSTRRIINREWKDEKEEVKQEGENGYRTTRTDIIKFVDGTQREVTRVIREESPVEEIIEYGTIVSEETDRREEVYEHETETYNDYELNYPQEKVITRGEDGYFKQTVKVITHSDGYVEEMIDEKKTERKEPVTEIIAIGMIERKSTLTETEEIDFRTFTDYDYELAYNDGEPHIIERGKKGSIRRTFEYIIYTDDTDDLKVEHYEKRVTTPAEPQTQKIGLIDFITEEEDERIIEFEVAYEYTKDLLEGEERLKQQGENGRELKNYEVTKYVTHPVTSVKRADKREEIKEDYEYEAPITHIIEIGAQESVVSIEDDIINKVVRFETEYIDDPTLYEGQEAISREGKDGSSEEKWQIITFHDGEVQRHHVSTSVVDPINAIIRRGTKNPIVKEWEEVEEKVLPYETVYIKTNDLADAVEGIAREGLAGTTTITYLVQEYYDGRVEREPIKEEKKDAINEIIRIGTDEVIVSQEQEVTVEIIEFETEYVDDDTLYIGEQRIQTEGQNGKTEYIYIVTEFEDGELERVLIGTTTTEAIAQVILVGTKREESEKELINVENLGTKHTGGFLYLEDGDRTIRATTATKIRPIWGYL